CVHKGLLSTTPGQRFPLLVDAGRWSATQRSSTRYARRGEPRQLPNDDLAPKRSRLQSPRFSPRNVLARRLTTVDGPVSLASRRLARLNRWPEAGIGCIGCKLITG